jgi:hypothetical protein
MPVGLHVALKSVRSQYGIGFAEQRRNVQYYDMVSDIPLRDVVIGNPNLTSPSLPVQLSARENLDALSVQSELEVPSYQMQNQ